MAQDTPSRKLDQYIVRFPDGLRDRIKMAAAANNRSMNAEIIGTLEAHYPERMSLKDMVDNLASLTRAYQSTMQPDLKDEMQHMVELIRETLESTSGKDFLGSATERGETRHG